MYKKTSNGDQNVTTATEEWTKECFEATDSPTFMPTMGPTTSPTKGPHKTKMWFWVGGIILLVLLIIITWIIYKKSKKVGSSRSFSRFSR